MAESFVATVGTSGLTKADLSVRLYQGSTRLTTEESGITVTEIGSSGDYLVGGLPDPRNGVFHAVTYEYAGVGAAYRWTGPAGGVPSHVVIPAREAGLSAGDFDLALYKDGSAQADVLTVTEIGGVGDYSVTSWPTDEPGDWVLRWARHGVVFAVGWLATDSVAGGSRYLEILARQRPFPFDVDANARVMFSCNYDALAAAPVVDFERELRAILSDAGLATFGSGASPPDDTWIGPAGTLPTGNGPYTQIIATGGIGPDYAHGGEKYERLSVQIVVRAKSFDAARDRALAIWRALDGQRNVTVAA